MRKPKTNQKTRLIALLVSLVPLLEVQAQPNNDRVQQFLRNGLNPNDPVESVALQSLGTTHIIVPGSWAFSEDKKYGCFPIEKIISGPVKKALYHEFSHLLLVSDQKKIMLTLNDLRSLFGSDRVDWYEFPKIYSVSNDGNRIIAQVRIRGEEERIRSSLVAFDVAAKKLWSQAEIGMAVFGSK